MRAFAASPAACRGVVAAAVGAGLVVGSLPAAAAPPQDAQEDAALVLLVDAAQASRSLTYAGTQYVATWGASATTSTLVEVEHAPGRGARVRTSPEHDGGEPVVLPSGAPDERLLEVLRDRYELRVTGQGHCAGRPAHVVEAQRPRAEGASAVAARFWVDDETGLLLRREVFDGEGRRLRSSAYLDLSVTPPSGASAPAALQRVGAREDAGDRVPSARLRALRDGGHVVPDELPGGYALFDARSRDHDGAEVLHLAYSDGLSTTSLFSQPGALGSAPPEGFAPRTVAGEPVWVSSGTPQRVVWAGGGRVWTLVSDAPQDAVVRAVAALPHEAMPDTGTGWRARLARGAARLAAALNPFSSGST